MRQLGRLLILLQKSSHFALYKKAFKKTLHGGREEVYNVKFKDFLVPGKFDLIVEATMSLADEEAENAKLPEEIRVSLVECCAILTDRANRSEDAIEREVLLQ